MAPGSRSPGARSQARSAARLAAVQALYQWDMEAPGVPALLHEFHEHRLGAVIEDAQYAAAETAFFDDLVAGTIAQVDALDALIAARLSAGWSLDRLDKPMRACLRVGAYELTARHDVPLGAVISEYVDVAKAFYAPREAGFVNGLLDALGKAIRG